MTNPSHSATIMVVDDNTSNLGLIEDMLRESGYQVRPYSIGRKALASALDDPPDLVLVDIHMPEMDGFELCRLLKAAPATSDSTVLFMGAQIEPEEKLKVYRLGGVDYIPKPFQVEEVRSRINIHLELKHSLSMLAQKNQALETAMAKLKTAQSQLVQSEKMAALGVLVAGIVHEINNPVNFIKTSLRGLTQDLRDVVDLLNLLDRRDPDLMFLSSDDLIETIKQKADLDILTDEIPALLNNALEGVRRTEEIVSGLRLYSRSDNTQTEPMDIHPLIDTALMILKDRLVDQISISKHYHPIPPLDLHPGKLIQVLCNLLRNAIEAIQEQSPAVPGTITIETAPVKRKGRVHAAISITDTGPGIPAELQSRIFDPFFTTKDIGKGTGLGLSISIGIIQEHGGVIEVDSPSSMGTCFSILIPIP